MTSPAVIAAALADLVAEESKRAAGQPSRGVKAIARAHHVPASTLREHWMRHRSAGAPRAPAPAPAREAVPDVEDDDETGSTIGSWSPARRVLASPRPPATVRALVADASAAVAGLEPGGRIVGLTGGQFSLLDLIRALLAVTGPADVLLSTWTAGIRDVETAAWLLAGSEIRSLRVLTDRSFPTRQPKYCARLIELFGEQSMVLTRTHAKFAVIRNERWAIALRSSMNLNKNTRWEQYDVDDDPTIADMFTSFADEVAAAGVVGVSGVRTEHVDDAFEQVLAAERKIRKKAGREMTEAVGDGLVPRPPKFDATAAMPLDRLEHEHRRAEECVAEAREEGQHSTAREWAALAGRIGVLLDEARQAASADEARQRAAEVRDVVALSAGVLRQLPVLARMAPEAAEEVYAELGRILGRAG